MSRYRLAKRPGRPHWYITWTEGRRSRRYSTGTGDREEAEDILAAFRLETPDPDSGEIGLAAVLNHYIEKHASKLPSAVQAEIAKAHLTGHFPLATVGDITPDAVEGYIEARQAKVSNETISRELSVLRAALRRAARDGLIEAAPHVPDVPRADPRERVLSRQEAARLLWACRGKRYRHLALFIRVGLYTGARPGAILDLTWERVSLDRRLIDFALPTRIQTKKRRTAVPFDSRLGRALAAAKKRARSAYVIDWAGEKSASVKKGFRSACLRAGLDGVTPGTLRHTAATWARMGGADLYRISALLGHTKLATTQRYAKYGPDYLQDVVAAIGRGARPARAQGGKRGESGA